MIQNLFLAQFQINLGRLNNMKWVFFKFKDNLFSLSQSTTWDISIHISLTRESGFLPDKNILESSAKSKANTFLDALQRSLMYNKNKRGPRIEPCGTPHST